MTGKSRKVICVILIILSAVLFGCGKNKVEEAESKSFGIDFMQGQAIFDPEQVVCGPDCAWVITAAKASRIYRIEYDTDTVGVGEISWQQGERESLINIAQREGILYAQVYKAEEHIYEIRKYIGGVWLKVAAFEERDADWKIVGNGLYVDGAESVYLISPGKVTRFGKEGQQEYRLSGNAFFFGEDGENGVTCVAGTEKGIALYILGDGDADKKWELKIPAFLLSGLYSSDPGILCLAAEEDLLFVDPDSGNLLARCDLTACGVSSVMAGMYNVEEESLQLYGTERGGELYCGLLSGRRVSAEQRTELIYGTMRYGGVADNVQAAIIDFNRTNENYYITIRNYGNYEGNDLQRLHMDMAGGNAPDILEMSSLESYEIYVNNGYLENLRPYIEQSECCEDILWNVLNTYEVGGGVYLMMPHFSLNGLAVNPQYRGKAEEWNMQTFLSIIEKSQGEQFVLGGLSDSQTLLWYMLAGQQDEFIDWERREASFESEEFLKTLALCKENGERKWPDLSEWTYADMQKNAVCGIVFLSDLTNYLTLTEVYGREYPVYGYPTSSGQVYEINMSSESCAIYAGSSYKEGAWEYVESLLDESRLLGHSTLGYGIPIRNSALEKYAEEQKESVLKYPDGDKSLTEGELSIMKDIIYHGNLVHMLVDREILNVVQEEAASYFYGDKSAQEVARIIQSRVELILSE